MKFIKKNIIWIVLIGFVVYKFWDKIKPMLGMKDDQAKSVEDESQLTDDIA